MIEKVIINEDLIEFLESRKLSNQYNKAKLYILKGLYKQVNFKIKEPKSNKIYYFRINKQYRALCKLDGKLLKVFDIDNHQN